MKTYAEFVVEASENGLYTYRTLNNNSRDYVRQWMEESEIPHPVPPYELHCTIVCSEREVPGYDLDQTPLMLSPTTFKLEVLGDALVIMFRSDVLTEQWQRAMNLGAHSKWPKFIPHVSLSYDVEQDFPYEELKPPSTFLVLDPEKGRPMVEGWASISGLTSSPEETKESVYIPQHSLNIPRELMPQISAADILEFVDWLEAEGTVVQFGNVPAAMLRNAQRGTNPNKIAALTEKENHKPLIISKDYYVLDGNHHWLASLNRNPRSIVDAYRVNLPFTDLLSKAHNFHKVHYK